MRSRPPCQPPRDAMLGVHVKSPSGTRIGWHPPTLFLPSPTPPPYCPETLERSLQGEKAYAPGACFFATASEVQGKNKLKNPRKLNWKAGKDPGVLSRGDHSREEVVATATQTLPNALVTQNRLQLPSASSKAPAVFLQKFKIEGNKACVYTPQDTPAVPPLEITSPLCSTEEPAQPSRVGQEPPGDRLPAPGLGTHGSLCTDGHGRHLPVCISTAQLYSYLEHL